MSNPLSVRRVLVQTINEKGEPEGPPTYGVMASDGSYCSFNDAFDTLDALNQAIASAPSILAVTDLNGVFDEADHSKIGKKNFYGKDWME